MVKAQLFCKNMSAFDHIVLQTFNEFFRFPCKMKPKAKCYDTFIAPFAFVNCSIFR